jgi:four helix bundle protein
MKEKIESPDDLRIHNLAVEIANLIWSTVGKWDHFSKSTLGRQIVRSSDSIAQNISEGFGRFYFKENKLFCYYARGSAYETLCSLNFAVQRGLISNEQYLNLKDKIETLLPKLNNYIKSTGKVPAENPDLNSSGETDSHVPSQTSPESAETTNHTN